MKIQELVRQNYLLAIAVVERKALTFPDGSAERSHWLRLAAAYRQLTATSSAEQDAVKWNRSTAAV